MNLKISTVAVILLISGAAAHAAIPVEQLDSSADCPGNGKLVGPLNGIPLTPFIAPEESLSKAPGTCCSEDTAENCQEQHCAATAQDESKLSESSPEPSKPAPMMFIRTGMSSGTTAPARQLPPSVKTIFL